MIVLKFDYIDKYICTFTGVLKYPVKWDLTNSVLEIRSLVLRGEEISSQIPSTRLLSSSRFCSLGWLTFLVSRVARGTSDLDLACQSFQFDDDRTEKEELIFLSQKHHNGLHYLVILNADFRAGPIRSSSSQLAKWNLKRKLPWYQTLTQSFSVLPHSICGIRIQNMLVYFSPFCPGRFRVHFSALISSFESIFLERIIERSPQSASRGDNRASISKRSRDEQKLAWISMWVRRRAIFLPKFRSSSPDDKSNWDRRKRKKKKEAA